jgi:hypothetical protein
VVALVVLQGLVVLSYAVVVPTWRAPDEPSHFDMVRLARQGGPWPLEGGDRRLSRQIEASYEAARFDLARRHQEPPLARGEAVPRARRPTFDELAADVADGAGNGMFQHPPGYYAAAAVGQAALTTMAPTGGEWAYDEVVLATRGLGAAVAALLPWLAFAAARRLGATPPAALAAAVVPLGVPQLAHIAGAVSNDGLLAVIVGALTCVSLRLAAGDAGARTGAAIGALAGAGLLVKGFALFAPALVGPAAVVAGWRARHGGQPRPARRAAGCVALATAIAATVGGWWWVRNLAVHGTLQPSAVGVGDPPAGFDPPLGPWLAEAAARLPTSFWGSFGWRQAQLPAPAIVAATTVLLVGLVAAFAWRARAGGRAVDAADAVDATDAAGGPTGSPTGGVAGGRVDAALALVPTVAVAGIVLVGAWRYHVTTGLTAALQGRYLLGGLVGLAAVAAVGWQAISGASRWLPVGALAGAVALHALAGWTLLERFYGPPGEAAATERLAALAAWAPVATPALAAIAVAVAVAVAVSARRLVAATSPARQRR